MTTPTYETDFYAWTQAQAGGATGRKTGTRWTSSTW